jgi:hypothetical protein
MANQGDTPDLELAETKPVEVSEDGQPTDPNTDDALDKSPTQQNDDSGQAQSSTGPKLTDQTNYLPRKQIIVVCYRARVCLVVVVSEISTPTGVLRMLACHHAQYAGSDNCVHCIELYNVNLFLAAYGKLRYVTDPNL